MLAKIVFDNFWQVCRLYSVYKVVVVCYLGYALIAFTIRHSRLLLFYLGIEKLSISYVSGPMIRSYIRGGVVLINILYIVLNQSYF